MCGDVKLQVGNLGIVDPGQTRHFDYFIYHEKFWTM